MPDPQLDTLPEARLFGAPSPLDSLDVVALLIDIEDCVPPFGPPCTPCAIAWSN